MGYSSPQSLIDMINQGAIVNCPAKDVARANNIFGPDLASVRGKSRKGKIKAHMPLRRKSQFRQVEVKLPNTLTAHNFHTHRTAIISPVLHDMSLIF